MKNEIYKSRIRAGRRTYFFDVKPTVKDKLYLEITESKLKGGNEFERHSVMFFPEEIKEVTDEINRIFYKFFDNKDSLNI